MQFNCNLYCSSFPGSVEALCGVAVLAEVFLTPITFSSGAGWVIPTLSVSHFILFELFFNPHFLFSLGSAYICTGLQQPENRNVFLFYFIKYIDRYQYKISLCWINCWYKTSPFSWLENETMKYLWNICDRCFT